MSNTIGAADCTSSKQPWILRGALIGAFLLIAGIGFAFGRARLTERTRHSPLQISAEFLSFGKTWEQTDFKWPIQVTNAESETLVVRDFKTSCTCTSISPREFELAPGEARVVEITIDLSSTKVQRRNERPVEISILPVFEHSLRRPVPWRLKGIVERSLAECPKVVDFSDSCVVGRPFPSREFTVRTVNPTDSVTVVSDSSDCLIHIAGRPTNATYQIAVSPATSLPVGKFRIPIWLEVTRADGTTPPRIRVDAVGVVVGDIQGSPPNVAFGGVALGQSLDETIRLRSKSNTSFSIRGYEIVPISSKNHGNESRTPFQLTIREPDGDPRAFVARCVAQESGTWLALARFRVTTQGGDKEIVVDVPLSAIIVER